MYMYTKSKPLVWTYLDLKEVHGVHGKRLYDVKVLENSFASRETVHHTIVGHHSLLTGTAERGRERKEEGEREGEGGRREKERERERN
jgi:hypothetical protein